MKLQRAHGRSACRESPQDQKLLDTRHSLLPVELANNPRLDAYHVVVFLVPEVGEALQSSVACRHNAGRREQRKNRKF